MIPNQWYAVLDSKEVKPGKPVGFTRMDIVEDGLSSPFDNSPRPHSVCS